MYLYDYVAVCNPRWLNTAAPETERRAIQERDGRIFFCITLRPEISQEKQHKSRVWELRFKKIDSRWKRAPAKRIEIEINQVLIGVPEQISKLNLTKENQTRRGEDGLKQPQDSFSRPKWKFFKEVACLKPVTCTPFRTVNRWNRERNWQTRGCKVWVTCHSGRSGNRRAKSRGITAHVTFVLVLTWEKRWGTSQGTNDQSDKNRLGNHGVA